MVNISIGWENNRVTTKYRSLRRVNSEQIPEISKRLTAKYATVVGEIRVLSRLLTRVVAVANSKDDVPRTWFEFSPCVPSCSSVRQSRDEAAYR